MQSQKVSRKNVASRVIILQKPFSHSTNLRKQLFYDEQNSNKPKLEHLTNNDV